MRDLVLRIERIHTSLGPIDGIWAPHTCDLVQELGQLLPAMALRVRDIEQVDYRLNDWGLQRQSAHIGNHHIVLQGFWRSRMGTITVLGAGGQSRVVLAVSMPTTSRPRSFDCIASSDGRHRLVAR